MHTCNSTCCSKSYEIISRHLTFLDKQLVQDNYICVSGWGNQNYSDKPIKCVPKPFLQSKCIVAFLTTKATSSIFPSGFQTKRILIHLYIKAKSFYFSFITLTAVKRQFPRLTHKHCLNGTIAWEDPMSLLHRQVCSSLTQTQIKKQLQSKLPQRSYEKSNPIRIGMFVLAVNYFFSFVLLIYFKHRQLL